jgi:hypothetical protein
MTYLQRLKPYWIKGLQSIGSYHLCVSPVLGLAFQVECCEMVRELGTDVVVFFNFC